MSKHARARALAAAVVSVLLPTGLCHAGTTWDGGGSNDNWSTANNWNPNGIPANNDTAAIVFTGSTRPTPILDTSWSISSLTFNAGATTTFTLNSSGGSDLTIGNVGLLQASSSSQHLNLPVVLGASQTWTTNGGCQLSVTGPINTNGKTLTVNAAALVDFNDVISGSGGFAKGGSATVTLIGSSANTFTGPVTVTTGTLQLQKSVLNGAIPGDLIIGNGSSVDTVLYELDDQIADFGSTITLNTTGLLDMNGFDDTVHDLVFVGGEVSTGGTFHSVLKLNGTISSNATSPQADIDGTGSMILSSSDKTFTIADGAAAIDLNIDVPISEDGTARVITKDGAGTLRLGKANALTGGVTLNAGTLILDNNNAAGTPVGTFFPTLTLNGGTLQTRVGVNLGQFTDVEGSATVLGFSAAATMTFSGTLFGSGNLTIDSADNTAIVLALVGSSGSLMHGTVTVNQGVLQLNKPAGTNAIDGPLVIGDGVGAAGTAKVLQVNSNQIDNASSVTIKRDGRWFASSSAAETIAALTMEGGSEVDLDTGVLTLGGNVTVTAGSGAAAVIRSPVSLGSMTRTFDVASGANLDLQDNVAMGGISKTGAGSLTFSFSNSFSGLTINAGTVFVNASGTPLGPITAHFANGTVAPINADRSISNPFSLDGPATFDCENVALTLSGAISGTGSLSKIGTSLLKLTNSANTYSGATTVFAGTLAVGNNGLGSAAGGTGVAIGATLQLTASYANAEPLTLTSAGSPDGGGGALVANMPAGGGSFAGAITNSLNATIASIGGDFTLRGNINTNNSPLTITGPGNTIVAALITGNGSLFKSGPATLTLTSANTYTGATVVNAGRMLIQNNLTASSSVSVTAGTIELATGGGQNRVIHTPFVSITGTGRVDLQDNKLITSSPVGALGSGNTYSGMTGLIQSGRNGGGWTGSRGIITSQSNATTGNFTTLGIATVAQAEGIASTATAVWAGQTVTGSDTLVMYTYGGDANLDGRINVDDYGRIDSSIPLGIAGWYNGDFNYDGKINVDDYGIIDSNIGIQGPPFSTATMTTSAVSAVPEPCLVIGLGGLVVLRRRRTRE